ncbi:alanine racemase [Devosia ginsengisoli]|uniref:alanine racemase n=1 Tax=Devosia ginsengisoli TaxID=400770 RepID=UPI0026EA9715|nr:alanine racemase [Devosia ginsengisoli]MCR6670701.1 alanine racemase [Devosia ginsengisoli]
MNQLPFNPALSAGIYAEAIAELAALDLAPGTKGLLPQNCPIPFGEVGGKGWNLFRNDVSFPVAALRLSAIERNSRTMQSYLGANGISLAPHGKTSMAPQLFARQIADGAWGITISSVAHLAVCLHFGFRRLIIANQVIGTAEIDYVAGVLARTPDLELFILVDSVAGAERLARCRSSGNLPQCLLEIGYAGGRTGCRSVEAALATVAAIRKAGLPLRGVAGFEGLLSDVALVDEFLDRICSIAVQCDALKAFADPGEILLSAGGSAYYDRLAQRLQTSALAGRTRLVARSGCYLTHDSGTYETAFAAVRQRDQALPADGFEPALLVFAQVLSRPEPEKAIISLGRRDVGTDGGMPVPLLHFRPGRDDGPLPLGADMRLTGINDQHGHLSLQTHTDLAVGDIIGFGISHPCTTFDKWKVLLAVDDDWTVIDAIKTFF